jgi:hypothetical protein
MPKKPTIPPALPGTMTQLPDAKGVNAKRDGRRRKGGAGVVALPKSGGSAKYRKSRQVPE